MKLLWFDTETTGLDPVENDIIQIAGKVIIDKKEIESFNILCQPHSFDNISEQALEVNGRTVAELHTFPEANEAYIKLYCMFETYIDKYDKKDKFIPCGQNVKFDVNFLGEYWRKCGDNYFFSYVGAASFDTMQLAVMFEMKLGRKVFESYRLENLYKVLFKKEMDGAHDALADIEATIEVAGELWRLITK